MKKLIAFTDNQTRKFFSRDGGLVFADVVSGATRDHEQNELPEATRYPKGRSWVRVVRNRIAFRHDDKRGPISATLNHAIY